MKAEDTVMADFQIASALGEIGTKRGNDNARNRGYKMNKTYHVKPYHVKLEYGKKVHYAGLGIYSWYTACALVASSVKIVGEEVTCLTCLRWQERELIESE